MKMNLTGSRVASLIHRIASMFEPEKPPVPASDANPPNQYRDSGQLGIICEKTFSPDVFRKSGRVTLSKGSERRSAAFSEGGDTESLQKLLVEGFQIEEIDVKVPQSPTMSGQTTVYSRFKPNRILVTEKVEAIFGGKDLPDHRVVVDVPNASDLILIGAYSGATNALPTAPDESCGISCGCFAASALGVGISWPEVRPGIPVTIQLAIEKSILYCAKAPDGYDPIPKLITVHASMGMFGPMLR